ncbi:TetR/AcrR family transcriptional regulator [Pengzhenrongella phosphoraccumulans]|uniref:TetR/AcrR family transcriptional regulator n=1 Tax=Pengzhenrongella phosphoraccumulans TaxID=3114394 RepID=UPI0038910F35
MTDTFDTLATASPATPVVGRRAPARARRPRQETARRREEILQAAMTTFGAKGYHNGSLVDVAEQVGITHAGVLHHFGSKDQLLIEVLEYRDRADVAHLEGQHAPTGLELFRHLVTTARLNMERPGIVQTYTVLSAESVTDNHPAQNWFRGRFQGLRELLTASLAQVCGPDNLPTDDELELAAGAIIGVMDGLQIQWLLDPDAVDLARSTAFAIEAILTAVVGNRARTPIL